MGAHMHDWFWQDAQRSIGQAELARLCGLTIPELDELVDYGALVPLVAEGGSGEHHFSGSWITPLREAARLRADYDLDLFTMSLLVGYLQRIVHLEHQVRSLQSTVPHPSHLPREGPTPWREEHA